MTLYAAESGGIEPLGVTLATLSRRVTHLCVPQSMSGPGRDRTFDIPIKSRKLYLLSYETKGTTPLNLYLRKTLNNTVPSPHQGDALTN